MVKAFQIASGPRVRFGRGEAAKVGEEAKNLGMAKPMFVTDPGLASSGALDSVLKGLEDSGIDYAFYDQAEANPSDTSILAARDFFSENGCDGFIAAGGGSTMDTAKATLAIVANGGVPSDYYGRGKATKPGPPLITVPTTAGTGSEVTMSSIVTDTDLMIKTVLADDSLFAKLAVVDSALLARLPSHIAAGAMMDALTHAVESVGSPASNPWTEALAFESIARIGAHGRAYVDDPADPEAADGISLAAMLAGRAFTNTGLGIVHSLAHPLGAYHGLHHGTANGIFLPPVMEFNLPVMREAYARMAPLLKDGAPQAAEAAIDAIRELNTDIGIPTSLREADVVNEDLDVLAKDAAESHQVTTNPVPSTQEDMKRLLQAVLE
ncbi:MAG: iron-containing alcohol dehydrogenase [Nitrospinae bacterium]|nr:iron-containing alcohol dehydrogenase [Nitrospinota bacterium]